MVDDANEPEGNEDQPRRSWFSEGLFLALGPVAGYLVTYTYEAGFSSAYHFPLSFISLSVESVLLAAGGLIVAVSMLFMSFNVLVMSAARRGSLGPIARAVYFVVAPVAIPLAIIVVLYGPHWREWIPVAVVFAVITALHFGFPIFSGGPGSYGDRLAAHEKSDADLPDVGILVAKRLGWPATLAVFYFPILLLTTWHVAKAKALNEVDYLVIPEIPQHVVLRQYGDRLILGALADSTGTLTGGFRVVSVSATGSVSLERRRVGPLTTRRLSQPEAVPREPAAVGDTESIADTSQAGAVADSAGG